MQQQTTQQGAGTCLALVRGESPVGNPAGDSPAPIKPFALRGASEEEYAAFAAFRNRIRAEQLPDDPPIPAGEYARRMQNVPPGTNTSVWVARRGAEVVATGGLDYVLTGENTDSVNFRIAVLPEARGRGMGCRMLALVAEVARRENRRLMHAHTCGRVPAGEAFMSRMGATKGLESFVDQLAVSELDAESVRAMREDAARRAEGFELLFWSGVYPQEHIEAIAALHNIINHQPRGGLEINDINFTPRHVRAIELRAFANGALRWSLYAREKATGSFAGFTEIYWHPNRPALVQQGFTGVFPAYRNRGLGRWLKAAMLERVVSERPQVKFIRTDTARSNAPMRRVNALFGFKPYSSNCTWQVETASVVEYLAGRDRLKDPA